MLYEVRCRSAAISLAIAGSALRMTSSVTGSSFALMPRLSPKSGARPCWRRCRRRPGKAPCRSVLAHQGGPGDPRPGPEVFAPVYRTGYRTRRIVQMHLHPSMSLGAAPRGETRQRQGRALADRREPDIDDLDRLFRRMMGVAPLVEAVERAPDGAAVLRPDLLLRDGHRQREFLADVAKIEMDPTLRVLLAREGGLRRHLLHRPFELPEIGTVEIGDRK